MVLSAPLENSSHTRQAARGGSLTLTQSVTELIQIWGSVWEPWFNFGFPLFLSWRLSVVWNEGLGSLIRTFLFEFQLQSLSLTKTVRNFVQLFSLFSSHFWLSFLIAQQPFGGPKLVEGKSSTIAATALWLPFLLGSVPLPLAALETL